MHSMIKAICLSLLSLGGAFAGTISLQAPSSNILVGDSFSVTVSVSGISDLYAFQFDLHFDPTLLSAVTVMEGGLFSSVGVSFSPGSIDNQTGVISFIGDALAGPGPGISSDGPLALIMFNGVGAGTGNINLGNVVLLDSALGDISADSIGAQVTTTGVSAVPEATSSSLMLIGIASLAWMSWNRRSPCS